jgi:TetR/AcrR family transcriptional regulator, transcriptional repressor for nem operon
MTRDAQATRERVLDAAHALVMTQGFSGTSVDAVLAAAPASKGAFFHHFPSKAALGDALLERYARSDGRHLDDLSARAERLGSDPVQRLLLMVGLLAEELDDSDAPPGCLFASFLYEREVVGEAGRALITESMLAWRERVGAMIRAAAQHRTPVRAVDAEALADGLLTTIEGAFVLARAVDDPAVVPAQLRLYREHLELLFGQESA